MNNLFKNGIKFADFLIRSITGVSILVDTLDIDDTPLVEQEFLQGPDAISSTARVIADENQFIRTIGDRTVPRVHDRMEVIFIDPSSGKEVNRTFNNVLNNVTSDNVADLVNENESNYMASFGQQVLDVADISHHLSTTDRTTGKRMQFTKMRGDPMNISSVFNELIVLKVIDNCVRDHLRRIHKRVSKKKINSLGDASGVTVSELRKYCVSVKVKMCIYDIEGKVIDSYYPDTRNKNLKNVYGVNYNNHFYPLKNKSMKKKPDVVKHIKQVENCTSSFLNTIHRNIVPSNVSIKSFEQHSLIVIESYQEGDTLYTMNDEYTKCKEILHKFGIADQITPSTKISNVLQIIEKLYVKDDVRSFLPNHERFVKGGFNYLTEYDESKPISTIDKVKCYSHALKSLDYLITVDYRQAEIVYNPMNIVPYFLYIVEPAMSTILLPDVNIYSGKHVQYCIDEGVDLKVLEGIETTKVHLNHYTQMVKDVYERCSHTDAKNMFNRLIGKMSASSTTMRTQYELLKVANNDESENSNGILHRLTPKFTAIIDTTESVDIYTKKPISIQVKDYSRRNLYEAMKELKLTSKDIVQIKTDSFSFYDPSNVIDTLDLDSTDLNKWKKEEFKKGSNSRYFKKMLSFEDVGNNKNVLINAYAGAGKSYTIINDVIPTLKDYIIITPTHSAIKEYKRKKFNCNTVQHYTNNKKIPHEQNIIIDEHGLIDKRGHDTLFKCYLAGRTIRSYGDWNQLFPVNEPRHYNQPHYLNMIFGSQEKMTTNYRNNFTKEYYDSIINGTANYGKKELSKYSTKTWKEADIVICYYNETRVKYNNLILKHKGYKSIYDVGVSIMCKHPCESLMTKGINNNFIYTITDNTNGIFTITDGVDVHEGIHKVGITKYFEPAYARTMYNIQGESIKSLFYPPEDYKKLTPRALYTVISRLKQILVKKKITTK